MPLQLAATLSSWNPAAATAIVGSLLKAGANPTWVSPVTMSTFWHAAAHTRGAPFVALFAQACAEQGPKVLHVLDASLQTPLCAAVSHDDAECVEV